MEKKCHLPVLDVLLTRNVNNIVTTAYRKTISNNFYLNWNSFEPTSWKKRTLKTLIDRNYLILVMKQNSFYIRLLGKRLFLTAFTWFKCIFITFY